MQIIFMVQIGGSFGIHSGRLVDTLIKASVGSCNNVRWLVDGESNRPHWISGVFRIPLDGHGAWQRDIHTRRGIARLFAVRWISLGADQTFPFFPSGLADHFLQLNTLTASLVSFSHAIY